MSTSIDKKIIEMELRNRQFERESQRTMSTLDSLKKKLNFKGIGKSLDGLDRSAKRVNFSPMASGVDFVTARFSALGVVGMSVISNLTNKAMAFGSQMAQSMFVKPLKDGMGEYETKLNSIQTILANTSSKGTTMKEVINSLDDLNTYADKTIYNFAEMTRNIGTFTAAGISLEESTTAIKGIANLAAISGSNAQQASTAMYQLSQALASGTVKLMDWNSVVNAGMGGQVFQDALKETAKVHGTNVDKLIKKHGSFRETLQEGWITSAVLTETLSKFTGDLTAEQLKSMGYTTKQTEEIMKMGTMATDAATKVKTFTQLLDTLAEAKGSGWAKTWELIFGDFEEAKSLWTSISDVLGGSIDRKSDKRNAMVQEWRDMGGRTLLINSLTKAWNNLQMVMERVKAAWTYVFPPMSGNILVKMTRKIYELVQATTPTQESLRMVGVYCTKFFKILHSGVNTIKQFASYLKELFVAGDTGKGLKDLFVGFGTFIYDMATGIDIMTLMNEAFVTLGTTIENLWEAISTFDLKEQFTKALDFFKSLPDVINNMLAGITDIERKAMIGGVTAGGLGLFIKPILDMIKGRGNMTDSIKETVGSLGDMFEHIGESFKNFSKAIKANSLLNMAKAIALLAGSIFLLAMIPADKLLYGTGAVVAMITSLVVAMKVLGSLGEIDEGKKGRSLFGLAGALLAMAAAVAILTVSAMILSFLNLPKALVGLGNVLMLIGVFAVGMDKFVKDIGKTSISLMVIALSLGVLVAAILPMAVIPTDMLGKGLMGLYAVLTGLTFFLVLIDRLDVLKNSIGLMAVSAAIVVLSMAVLAFAIIPFPFLIQGITALGVVLLMLGGAVRLMGKSIVGAGALIGAAIALNLLVAPIAMLGAMELEKVSQGLVSLVALLGVLVLASIALKSSIIGSAALIALSVGLIILAGAVRLMAEIPTNNLWQAVLAVGALFGILMIAAVIAVAISPGLLVLSVSIVALGVAVMVAGLGMSLFAGAMAAFAAGGSAGFIVLAAGLTSLASLIPYIVKQVCEGWKVMVNFIVDNAPLISKAITEMLGIIVASLPMAFMEAIGFIIQGFIDLCNEIEKQAGPLADAVVGALDAVTTAVEDHWGEITDLMGRLMTGLLGGISQAIRDYGPTIIYDMEYISGFMAEGLVRGFGAIGPSMVDSVIGLAGDMWAALKGEEVNAYKAGYDTTKSIAQGTRDGTNELLNAVGGMMSIVTTDLGNEATEVKMAPVLDMTQPNLQLDNFKKALTATHKDAAKMEGTINKIETIIIKPDFSQPLRVEGVNTMGQTVAAFERGFSMDEMAKVIRRESRR